ncbi:MAG: FAD-dependent oxidoreductase [Burkholderiaceae bacterium]|nr:FAD-dependent oxidoreductase [Burkholderiaceae bacterium]
MRDEVVRSDLTVIGGGLSGVCAAIAAARLGLRVALVQNRPVLGGVSSSEIRVWVGGANGLTHNRHARETGIIGEMLVENQYRNPDGNPYLWDMVVHEAVKAEPNIALFLNTDVHELAASGEADARRIDSVTGWMTGAERRIQFESPLFADCTGDALVGFLAGAQHRVGRESRDTYGEPWAPEQADSVTLGSTILFHTRDAGHPVPFVAPSFARDISQTGIPVNRILSTGDSGAKYWWIEFGGELDTIHDNEAIRDELWSAVYGIWDYIKNSGKFDAAHLTLEWVGSLPGKRESRRLLGDYVFTQHDVVKQSVFEDTVGFGGWMVDLHPPGGMYSDAGAASNMYADGVFQLPYRSLYSANVGNLFMAGRNISASHVGFGATRVMATCAVMGEAIGTAAALCLADRLSPRALGSQGIVSLQQQLLRQDASLVGLANRDPADLARGANASASSSLQALALEDSAGTYALTQALGIVLPVDPRLETVQLLIDADQPATLELELWSTARPENFVPHQQVARASVTVAAGRRQWVSAPLAWAPGAPAFAFIVVKPCPGVQVHLTAGPHTGLLAHAHQPQRRPHQFHIDGTDAYPPKVLEWDMKALARRAPCLRVEPATQAFAPQQVLNGLVRPYGSPNLWMSAPLNGQSAWLELAWDQPVKFGRVCITFNDDLNEHLNNLHKHHTPFRVFPELVRDYRLEAWIDGQWQTLVHEQGNRRRRREHTLSAGCLSQRLRLVVEATNGSAHAEVYEIRVYA